MNYNFFVFIIIILFIFFILNYFLNRNENFSDKYPITFCTTGGSLGIRYSDNSCVPFGQASDVKSSQQFKHYSDDSQDKSTSSNQNDISSMDINQQNINTNITDMTEPIKDITDTTSNNDCIEKNINYGEVCKKRFGNNYGIKKMESCNNNKGVKVICEKMVFDGKTYNNDNLTYATDCMSDSLDLNIMCNYYMPKNIREKSKKNGYNSNSVGLNTRLRGKYGDCYTSNGKPDLSKNRGICNFRKFNEIDKVRPFNFVDKYNKFTGCHNMENYNFANDCKNRLGLSDSESVFADIKGFDCMPGYARAKCVNKNELIKLPPDLQKFKKDSKSNLFPYNINN